MFFRIRSERSSLTDFPPNTLHSRAGVFREHILSLCLPLCCRVVLPNGRAECGVLKYLRSSAAVRTGYVQLGLVFYEVARVPDGVFGDGFVSFWFRFSQGRCFAEAVTRTKPKRNQIRTANPVRRPEAGTGGTWSVHRGP